MGHAGAAPHFLGGAFFFRTVHPRRANICLAAASLRVWACFLELPAAHPENETDGAQGEAVSGVRIQGRPGTTGRSYESGQR